MLSEGTGIFLQFPEIDSEDRALLPGTVLEVGDTSYTAAFEDDDIVPEAGQEAVLYFEVGGEFMQQKLRIDAVMKADPQTIIGFATMDEPTSAESRQCPRVPIESAGLSATVDGTDCPLVDVSASGFSVITAATYQVGQLIEATLRYEGRQFSGTACVQNVREAAGDRVRYGLQGVGDRKVGSTLQHGQQFISMDLKRRQLRALVSPDHAEGDAG